MKTTFNLIVACTIFGILSGAQLFAETKRKIPFKELIARQGGFIMDVRTMKGRLVIVNAQDEIKAGTISLSTKKFENDTKIRIEHTKGTFDITKVKRVGEATVYVISNESLPATMVSPDDRWGLVNVAKLRTDKSAFFNSRVQKSIVRVAGLVLGAGDSFMYPMCLTGHIKNYNELDEIPHIQLPQDVMQRIMKSMQGIGITPFRMTTYRRACQEGWAPAPTNEYQKAVWDKVHAMPTAPIKIKPETKKVRE